MSTSFFTSSGIAVAALRSLRAARSFVAGRTFLDNHRPEMWASDFFTVHTLWFQTFYVLGGLTHEYERKAA